MNQQMASVYNEINLEIMSEEVHGTLKFVHDRIMICEVSYFQKPTK